MTPEQRLADLEAQQRRDEPGPGPIVERHARRVSLPAGGSLPRSEALLERLYAGEFVPREKKELVVDTRRSLGPTMVSVDEPPMVLLDACSQIATTPHGLGNPHIVRALHHGRFGAALWSNPDTTVATDPVLAAYAEALLHRAPPALRHAAFVAAGGAEANEKALRLARLHAPPDVDGHPRRHVLAFRHGFHGRTFAALMATWNPDKRAPFELRGYEAVFAEPDLADVARVLDLEGERIFAVLIEPMMAEGGDVHLTRELLLGLRELTRARGLPLVIDEVQTGFATGGPFFWWQRHGLGLPGTPEGEATSPDLLILAKKAGLGVVLSRWPDPEPAPVHVASALRGLIHLQHAHEQAPLEARIAPHLQALAQAHPGRVLAPRAAGTTFAFDLPDAASVDAFIQQRFQRGFMTYPAGARTVRFRLNASWGEDEVGELFSRVAAALQRLDDPTARQWPTEGDLPASDDGDGPGEALRIEPVAEGDWAAIMAAQALVYEPARQTAEPTLRDAAAHGLGLVARASDGELLGFAFAVPVERRGDVDGPRHDPTFGAGVTLYADDLTVLPAARGRGVGRALKRAQLEWAKARGYRFVTGRNKVGATPAMSAINRAFGAFAVHELEGQYGGAGAASYYAIPLAGPPAPPAASDAPSVAEPLDLASGVQTPLRTVPAGLLARDVVGPAASKLNLSNYATLDSVHYMEHLRAIAPRGTGHAYVTSSRDETVDKCLRALRLARPEGQLAVGLAGGYVGHTTAAARSLSDPRGFAARFGLFDWPRLPHPDDVGEGATLAALDELVARHGAPAILAVVVELVGERSGKVLWPHAAAALAAACRRHDLPLVLVETTTGGYRSGAGAWGVDALPSEVVPDAVLWYPGGQLGHVFVGDRYYVAKPVTLISTWDGDELCMIREHERLRAAWRLDLGPTVEALDELVGVAAARHPEIRVGGAGLYRTWTLPETRDAAAVHAACAARGLRLGRGAPGVLVFAPALDEAPARLRGYAWAALHGALDEAMA